MSVPAAFLEALEDDDRPSMRALLLGPDRQAIGDFLIDDFVLSDDLGLPDRPARFASYLLLEDGVRGGFSEVFQAWNVELKCIVALKRPWSGADDIELSRFLHEARTLAGLQHPHIVPILEFSEWLEIPYFTMPWCGQGSLKPLVDKPADAVRQMLAITSAVSHAHSRGIWHMDLKPNNILIDDHDRPLVADFGLALNAQQGDSLDARRGTPEYMSPEQAVDQPMVATAATDVYGLGALLFFLLTGEPPLRGDTPEELRERARTQDRPSVRSQNPAIPVELDAIIRKALHRDPSCRYASPDAFADDLQAWLSFRPVQAWPVGLGGQTWLWCCRHPVIVVMLIMASLLAGLASVIAWQQSVRSHTEFVARQRADLFRELAVEPMGPPRAGWRERLLDRVRAWTSAHPGADHELRDRVVGLLHGPDARLQPSRKLLLLEASSVAFEPAGHRLLLGGMRDTEPTRIWDPQSENVTELMALGPGPVAFRDGRPIQWCVPDGARPELWDLQGKRRLLAPRPDAPVLVLANGQPALAMTPDGATLAAVAGDRVCVWDARTGECRWEKVVPAPRALALSTDGRLLALGEASGKARVLAVGRTAETVIASPTGQEVFSVAFDPVGTRLAVGSVGGAAIVQLSDGQVVAHCHGGLFEVGAIAWSSNGSMLLVATGGVARLFDAYSGQPLLDLPCTAASSAAFADDGRLLITERRHFGNIRPTQLWRLEPGRGLMTLPGLAGVTQWVAINDAGTLLAVLTHTWHVAIYDLHTGALRHITRMPGWQAGDTVDNCALAFSTDGQRLAVACGVRATVWNVADGTTVGSWSLPAGGVVSALLPWEKGWRLFRAEGGGGRRVPTVWELHDKKPARIVSTWPTVYYRVTRALALPGRNRFVFYACGHGTERYLIGITSGGSGVWQDRLDLDNENVYLQADAGGRVLLVRSLYGEFAPFRLDADQGKRLGPMGPLPLCVVEETQTQVTVVGEVEAGVYRQAAVVQCGVERFRLGPGLMNVTGTGATRDGNRIIVLDRRGAAVLCVVPEVERQLRDLGLTN